jgi:serine/threonine protein kinase
MGVVWRGWLFHAPNGPRAGHSPELLALKVLRPQAQVKRELRALFVNEADTIRRLSHPNIVRYYDLFEWGSSSSMVPDSPRVSIPAQSVGTPSTGGARGSHAGWGAGSYPGPNPSQPIDSQSPLVLALEYIVGDTLEDVITRHVARARLAGGGNLPGIAFRRAWYYFEQLLGALAATHAMGVVHRDVKPSNILIREDGIVKLTDFGIARFATNVMNAPPSQVQSMGFAPGTGAYMSPEQVLSKPLDGRSDLYSAALVLYEMLSGQTPFAKDDDSEFMIRKKQVEAPVPPIRTWLAQAPPALDALFARALAKDPAYRFANAIEMGNAFRVGLGLPETAEWLAQTAFAAEAAPQARASQVSSAQEKRMATLREFVVNGYRTLKLDMAR